MALEVLFKKRNAEIGALTLDASLQEDHSAGMDLTEHPVESGVDITDHKRVRPRQVTITGVISNTPLEIFNFGPELAERAETAWQYLNEAMESDEFLTVVTTLAVYENMQIVDLTAPRNAKLGNALEFTCTMREVFIVESETVAFNDEVRPKKIKKGTKGKTSATSQQRESFISKWFRPS